MSNYGKLNIKELSALAFGPVPYLLEEFIPEKSLGILVGEWGIGKSPFALQLQLSIASGIPFLGKYKIKKDNIKTLYIDLENGAHPVLWMITSISKHLGIELQIIGASILPTTLGVSKNFNNSAKMSTFATCSVRRSSTSSSLIRLGCTNQKPNPKIARPQP